MIETDADVIRDFFEGMNDAVLVVDLQGSFIAANDAAVERFGYTREELLSRGPRDLTTPAEAAKVADRIANVEENETLVFETVQQTKQGRKIPVEINASRISYDGEPAILSVARDISERREYRRQIEALHDATQQLLDAETTDEVGEIAVAAAEDLLGFPMSSVWAPAENGSTLELVANSTEHQQLLDDAGTPSPTHPKGNWLWDVFEAGETIVRDPIPAEDLAADVPLHSAIFVPLGDHGVLSCAADGRTDFDEKDETVATLLGQNVTAALDQIERNRQLQAEREKYRTLVENSNDAIAVAQQGQLVIVNQELAEMIGADSPAEMEGDSFLEYVAPQSRAEVTKRYQAWLDGEDAPRRDEMTIQAHDGSEIVVEYNVSPITFDGDLAHLAILRDVTERRKREDRLRRREARFRTMFQSHSAPMLLIDPESGSIEDANEAAAAFYGYSSDELLSKTIQDINRLSPEAVARERERAEKADRNHFVFDHELATGEVRTVEVHSSPITLADEELLFSVIHDVTDRVAYEQELERYKELMENVPVGIYRNTPGEDGEFIEVNPAMVDMFDADSEADLLDHAVSDLYATPERREEFSDHLLETDPNRKEEELRLETLSGTEFWGSVTAFATETDSGTYFDGVIQDITARKEYEDRLEEQRDNLDVLNRVVRHDIRNDLQIVLAYLDLLYDYADDDAHQFIDTALESTKNAVDLTKTARDMAEVMLKSERDLEPVEVRRVIERELDEIRATHTDAVVKVDGSLPDVSVVANDLLDSVFRNLFKNGIQHNDKDVPELVVSTTQTDDSLLVSVADNGPGVPDSQKDAIFGKGEKGLESEGTGVGLYLVSTLVDSYGGEVWIDDNEPEGAVFTVELLIAD
ncbi:PAS domain S-box protein [Halorientalis brevis]|uniref:histidine kinase n=1 Tax=Halorientalis brevis TaxID=1126241 RepID=A0ABD6CHU4_9EURY